MRKLQPFLAVHMIKKLPRKYNSINVRVVENDMCK